MISIFVSSLSIAFKEVDSSQHQKSEQDYGYNISRIAYNKLMDNSGYPDAQKDIGGTLSFGIHDLPSCGMWSFPGAYSPSTHGLPSYGLFGDIYTRHSWVTPPYALVRELPYSATQYPTQSKGFEVKLFGLKECFQL
jgi:hypothetical protein